MTTAVLKHGLIWTKDDAGHLSAVCQCQKWSAEVMGVPNNGSKDDILIAFAHHKHTAS